MVSKKATLDDHQDQEEGEGTQIQLSSQDPLEIDIRNAFIRNLDQGRVSMTTRNQLTTDVVDYYTTLFRRREDSDKVINHRWFPQNSLRRR